MALLEETILEALGIQIPLGASQEEINDHFVGLFESLRRQVAVNRHAINGGIEFGNPVDLQSNIDGRWVTVSITNANQLGTGAGAPVTVTHNMNIPPTLIPGQAYYGPNVRWVVKNVTFGDKTGANAAPAALANPLDLTDVLFNLGDTVTADAIDLRFYADAGFAPSATQPLTFDLYIIGATT